MIEPGRILHTDPRTTISVVDRNTLKVVENKIERTVTLKGGRLVWDGPWPKPSTVKRICVMFLYERDWRV